MAGKRLYQIDAIVIRRRDQGEADRVLTLCTPQGKVAVIAKGVRKVHSRKAGHLELFAHTRLVLARSRSSWDIVSQAETVEPHTSLRGDLTRGTYARYVAELYDRFVAEGEGGEPLFDLLRRTLGYLCEAKPGREMNLLVRAYEQRLLALVGFRPEWEWCVGDGCGQRLREENGPFGLAPAQGGALCPACYRAVRHWPGIVPLSPAALQLLRACQREPFSRLRERPVPPAVLNEVERAARHYITYHLEQDLRSGVFLRRVRREEERYDGSGNVP
ncbi:MAG TPA: DNA repair protein RecO [Chloroflexi bacterium]|nr:DNA repair protein RecO [Chloroflexota bacterium]